MENSDKRVQVIKAMAIGGGAGAVRPSQVMMDDPFKDMYGPDGVIEPPYPLILLTRLPESSDILGQCVDAYETNIPGFGFDIKYTIDYESDEIDKSIKDLADLEYKQAMQFFKYCNPEKSFVKLNKMVVKDRELNGNGFLEVITYGNGKPCGFEYIPSHTMRLTALDPQIINVKTIIMTADGPQEVVWPRKFRRFVQIRNNVKTFFKQYGDPRIMDKMTGEFVTSCDPERVANAVIHFKIDVSWSPYGVPRYLGPLLRMMGSRKADQLNLNYFEDGRHVPLAVVVENGMLSKKSYEELVNYSKGLNGLENAHKFMLIEAEGIEKDATGETSDVKVRLEKLAEILQKDGLFSEYNKDTRNIVRSSFRLPSLYTGDSQDFTRATAYEAKKTAEEQVFQPERDDLSHMYNTSVFAELGFKYIELTFKGPNLSDPKERALALNPYITGGAATPNMMLDALGELLDKNFEPFPEEWANKPLALTLKELDVAAKQAQAEASAKQAEANAKLKATQQAQQVTDSKAQEGTAKTPADKQEAQAADKLVEEVNKMTDGFQVVNLLKSVRDDIREALEDVSRL